MSLGGGDWAWSAILRYLFMMPFLALLILAQDGPAALRDALCLFRKHFRFWLLSGTLGCGVFYAGICIAADHARGWVIASTWQATIIASPLVLISLGFKVPGRSFVFSTIILIGIWLINARGLASGITGEEFALGVVPVLISAVAYPLGNQLVNAAKNGTMRRVPRIGAARLDRPAVAILLMSLGSLPFWLAIYLIARPPAPTGAQVTSTFIVALLSGVIATSIFFYARNATADPFRIAAVDAAQAAEVGFSLLGELVLLGAAIPDLTALLGLLLLTAGLVGYCFATARRG
ncbi:MAG: multidrug resistance efflux transporter family protein [Alphaproteobacteria bacterium]|nr:multidrug resistance efflux transporter family protein [Alphaproteobacteria bacterium]